MAYFTIRKLHLSLQEREREGGRGGGREGERERENQGYDKGRYTCLHNTYEMSVHWELDLTTAAKPKIAPTPVITTRGSTWGVRKQNAAL